MPCQIRELQRLLINVELQGLLSTSQLYFLPFHFHINIQIGIPQLLGEF